MVKTKIQFDIKVIPDFLKTYFTEENITEVPSHWRRPQGYNLKIGLSTSYYNFLSNSIDNIAKYCGISSRQVESPLKDENLANYLAKNDLLTSDHHMLISNYGTSVLFKSKEDGIAFIEKFNKCLKEEYEDLESQIKIKLLLSSQNINEYENHNVIFTSRHLAEHFINSFNVKYFFRTLEIVRIEKEGLKGIEAYVKFYTEVCGQCHLCGRALTTEFSRDVGIGEICCKTKLGVKRTKTEDVCAVKNKIKDLAHEIGIIGPIFIPKNQISKLK